MIVTLHDFDVSGPTTDERVSAALYDDNDCLFCSYYGHRLLMYTSRMSMYCKSVMTTQSYPIFTTYFHSTILRIWHDLTEFPV
jgi:hypothetical protein